MKCKCACPTILKSTNFLKSEAQKLYLILAGLFIAAFGELQPYLSEVFLAGLFSVFTPLKYQQASFLTLSLF